MTWIRTIPLSQGDEKLRQAMEGQKAFAENRKPDFRQFRR